MEEWIWCGSRFHAWIAQRIERSPKQLKKLRERFPNLLFFESFYDATLWIEKELLSSIPNQIKDLEIPDVVGCERIRCSASLYDWVSERVENRDKTKDLYFQTYAQATEWIHDNILIHINEKQDLERFK